MNHARDSRWPVAGSPGSARRTDLDIAMYIGPEVIMPLASALAAAAGVLLMFWRRVTGFVRLAFSNMRRTAMKLFSR